MSARRKPDNTDSRLGYCVALIERTHKSDGTLCVKKRNRKDICRTQPVLQDKGSEATRGKPVCDLSTL
jgi:hypothetical protein